VGLTLVHAWLKLTVYVVCIGVGLELAHRLYWRLLRDMARTRAPLLAHVSLVTALPAIPFTTAAGITWIFSGCLDNCPLAFLGLLWTQESSVYLLSGFGISLLCVLVILGIGCAGGWIRVCRPALWSGPRERSPRFFCCLSDFVLGATYEEIAMRGYVLAVLLRAGGDGVAIIGSSVVFSLFHLIKHPKMPAIFTINAFVFGILTAHARLATGALWLPIGMHIGWNVAMGPILGMPCSGRDYENGLLKCSTEGPNWVSGGLYSPDAGILGMAGLLVAVAGLLAIAPLS